MASSKHHCQYMARRQGQHSYFINLVIAPLIRTAALDVRWYSISERLSFSLCKVSFPSHLKFICIHHENKRNNYKTIAHIPSSWHKCLFSSSLYYLFDIYLTNLRAYSPYIFILFYSLYIFPCGHNLLVNKLFCSKPNKVYLTFPRMIGYSG